MHPDYLFVFLEYFIPASFIIFVLLTRNEILKYSLIIAKRFASSHKGISEWSRKLIKRELRELIEQEFVYFTKGENISIMNNVMMYVHDNEITRKLKVVNVVSENSKPVSDKFISDLEVLDRAYPEFVIEYLEIPGKFGPELIQQLSKEWDIPINFMFISTPSDRFSHHVSELGGVRVIV
jgi:hypothetical protein